VVVVVVVVVPVVVVVVVEVVVVVVDVVVLPDTNKAGELFESKTITPNVAGTRVVKMAYPGYSKLFKFLIDFWKF